MRRALVAALLAASSLATAGEAAADTPCEAKSKRRPGLLDARRWTSLYYPQRAAEMGIEGVATVNCLVVEGGLLRECAVVSEEPDGHEFGEAVVKMSHLLRTDAAPVGERVQFDVRFVPPDEGRPDWGNGDFPPDGRPPTLGN